MNHLKKVFTSVIKGIDEQERTLTAAISTDGIDRMGDVVDPKGVDLKNYRKNPVVLWAHDYATPPIGKALWVRREGNALISKVKFADSQFAQEIFQLYKGGFMNAFSIGFIPTKIEYAKDEDYGKPGKPRRTFTAWELLEYSAVPVPANPEAVSLAMQKGILKDETLIKTLTAEEDKTEAPLQEFNDEEKAIVNVTIDKDGKVHDNNTTLSTTSASSTLEIKWNAVDELTAENEQLKATIKAQEKEISDLKFKLFTIYKAAQSKPEITVEGMMSKTLTIFDGAIRKATGKVD